MNSAFFGIKTLELSNIKKVFTPLVKSIYNLDLNTNIYEIGLIQIFMKYLIMYSNHDTE